MTTLNAYATLAEYKSFVTSRGEAITSSAVDDGVIEMLLKAASRYMDTKTQRYYYPFIETRYYDVPRGSQVDPRLLRLDGDLLEVITLTNGDSTSIPSTEYKLHPRNITPYYGIRLNDNSAYRWASNGAGDIHAVIAVAGIWGYHRQYAKAWETITTANEALDATETGYDVTASAGFVVGDLIRFDNEFGYVSSTAGSNTLTITRGENGSAAATHDTAINVKVWRPVDNLKEAVLEMTLFAYKRRFGQSSANIPTITAAGVVLTPRDVPVMAADFISVNAQVL